MHAEQKRIGQSECRILRHSQTKGLQIAFPKLHHAMLAVLRILKATDSSNDSTNQASES